MLIGRRYFALDVGILSKIEDNTYQVIAAQSSGQTIAPGTVFALNKTYCQKTYQTNKQYLVEYLMVDRCHSESINSFVCQECYIQH